MQILDQGHQYELDNFGYIAENKERIPQQLQFIRKEQTFPGSTELKIMIDGTTNEEVLRVLIDRMEYLQELLPCEENVQIISLLNQALHFVNMRRKDRDARGITGTLKA